MQALAAEATALGLRKRSFGKRRAAGIFADLRVARLDRLGIQAARHTARFSGALGTKANKRVGAVVRIRTRRTRACVGLAALRQADVFRLAAASIATVLTTAIVALFRGRLTRQTTGNATATTASSGVRRRERGKRLRGVRTSVLGASRGLCGGTTVHTAVARVKNLAAIVIAIETALSRATTILILVAARTKLLTVGRRGVGTSPNMIATRFGVVVADRNGAKTAGTDGARVFELVAARAIVSLSQ